MLLESTALVLGKALHFSMGVPRYSRVELAVEHDRADEREEESEDHDPHEHLLSSLGDHVSMLAMDANILAGLFDEASLPLSEGAVGEGIKLRLAMTDSSTIGAGGEPRSMCSSATS